MRFRLSALALSATMLISCCASSSKQQTSRPDPLEGLNRSMYTFNYTIMDPYIVRPIALAWNNYIPQSARNGLSNLTSNLEEPAAMANYLLQGNPYQSMVHFTRFFLNTLVGMGGFIDVASIVNPKLQRKQPRRFGSTLGYYGVGYGLYIHLPFYGSVTMRDDGGDIIDTFYPMLSWLNWPLSIIKWMIEKIEMRAQLLSSDGLLNQSLDPYITVREAYFQKHDFIANSGKLKLKNNPNAKEIESELSEIDVE